MAKKKNKQSDKPNRERKVAKRSSGSTEEGKAQRYVLTAKDAGWRPSGGVLVLPMTLVPIDPPEPRRKRRPPPDKP